MELPNRIVKRDHVRKFTHSIQPECSYTKEHLTYRSLSRFPSPRILRFDGAERLLKELILSFFETKCFQGVLDV